MRERREASHEPLGDCETMFAESDDELVSARRNIDGLLERLPDVKFESLSVVAAANLTGLSESAINANIHRGLMALAAHVRGLA